MARTDLRDGLHERLKPSRRRKALVLGGTIKGAYYPATILADLKPGMEELTMNFFWSSSVSNSA
jgi:succinate-semialdehyde dehydrogenase/glutarate-semialdehyde dehydrogenase